MENLAGADSFIQGLRKQGYPVCLDDFGAGAANFEYLASLDVDIVKLDGDAIRGARKAHKGKAFMKAFVGLCRELGVVTVAEMIDDEPGLAFVRECGVHYVQGYLFGRPSPDIRVFKKTVPAELFSRKTARKTA
jgi:EAL domain-containing protein (putative c-di-GMP-specific phosphodiesterase class I)